MPRRMEIVFEDYDPFGSCFWKVRIAELRKLGRVALAVVLEHLDGEQCGRVHTIELPLPPRPGNLTGQFFAALGFTTTVGSAVALADASGRCLMVRFEEQPQVNGQYRAAGFQAANEKETTDVR
jgi:hypothetical protein